jgi:hypothetical protein
MCNHIDVFHSYGTDAILLAANQLYVFLVA